MEEEARNCIHNLKKILIEFYEPSIGHRKTLIQSLYICSKKYMNSRLRIGEKRNGGK